MCAHTLKEACNWRCNSPSHVWNIMKKIGEDNQKVDKTNWVISQALALGLKHDKIRTWLVLGIPS